MANQPYFSNALFSFLRNLKKNNNRDWFKANKAKYDAAIKDPALRFIADFGPYLQKISPEYVADPRAVGGSLFRIYRDVRFSKDKSPYKTHTGIHFKHAAAKNAHTPGFYLHLEPGNVFVGIGLWQPPAPVAKQIREAIVDKAAVWKRMKTGKRFAAKFKIVGDMLKRPPRGFDPEHPLVEDLRLKDFTAMATLTQKSVTAPDFMRSFAALCRAGAPLNKFLCEATGLSY